MTKIIGVLTIVLVLVGLLAFSAAGADADEGACDVGINLKTGEPCRGFNPVSCASCSTPVLCAPSVWWGGAFGNLLLTVGVMGWIAWPLWRHRKKRPALPPIDLMQQRLIIMAKERARWFRETTAEE